VKKKTQKVRKKIEFDELFKQFKTAYKSQQDNKKYLMGILLPSLAAGIIIIILPSLLALFGLQIPGFQPSISLLAGLILIILGICYPYLKWKNRESDINGKIHFFITHLRVLAISDLSLKEIIKLLGGNPAYGALGEEMRKVGVLSDSWRMPLSKSFLFISKRTPSKILSDFLDRFSQSLNSGVEPREFIENEQSAVLEDYKTMYETSNDNITLLNEVYVSLLISIIFVMSLGIVLPIIMGTNDMNQFLFLSSFLLIISEVMLLYLLKAMVPTDEVWHRTGEKGELEDQIETQFQICIMASVGLGILLFVLKYLSNLPLITDLPFEILMALACTPLIVPGFKTYAAESMMHRKERNFLSFLPALGSISTMRGGKINESVYYLSQKDYGVLTTHIRALYRRLRTRINDDQSWEWFGVDSGSNYIQRSCEMFRQATAASANPRNTSRMIVENVRKIRDLRVKKFSVVNTSAALFAGITFGISFSIYTSLVIAQHLNNILLEGIGGDPFSGTTIDVGNILQAVPPPLFNTTFIIVFVVLLIHSFLMSLTVRTMRGSHLFVTLLYFVPMVWIVALTAAGVNMILGGYLGM